MKKILIIGDAYRKDYMSTFKVAAQVHHIFWLHANLENYVKSAVWNEISVLDWQGFSTMQKVFDHVKPDFLVLFHVENYMEALALLIARSRGLEVKQVDHGLLFNFQGNSAEHVLKYDVHLPFMRRLRYKLFCAFSGNRLSTTDRVYYKSFIQVRRHCEDPKRIYRLLGKKEMKAFLPDEYIAYSAYNFNAFITNYGLKDISLKKRYIGFPYFDEYAKLLIGYPSGMPQKKVALIIDQPLVNYHVSTEEVASLYKKVAGELSAINYTVYLKPHPLTDKKIITDLESNTQVLTDNKELLNLYADISVCLGFYSTLLLPFAANKSVVMISLNSILLENYLDSIDLFVEAHVAEPLKDPDNLSEILSDWPSLLHKQLPWKEKFEKEILYKFDGLSRQRMSDIFWKLNMHDTKNSNC